MTHRWPTVAVILAVCASASLSYASLVPIGKLRQPSAEARAYTGKVMLQQAALKERGIASDEETGSRSYVLVTDDGRLLNIIRNEGSRMLSLDPELRDRPVRLIGTLVAGTQMLQVERVQTVVDGRLHDVDYWCEKCQLAYTEPGICVCCGMQNVRREYPADASTESIPAE